MNRESWTALVVGALLVGCGAGMVAHEVVESNAIAQASPAAQQWEHVCLMLDDSDFTGTAILPSLGQMGFEMAGIGMDQHYSYRACFKRPVVYQQSAPTITPLPSATP